MENSVRERIPRAASKDIKELWNYYRGVEARIGAKPGQVAFGRDAMKCVFGDRDMRAADLRCACLDIFTRAYGFDVTSWPSVLRNFAFRVAAVVPAWVPPLPPDMPEEFRKSFSFGKSD